MYLLDGKNITITIKKPFAQMLETKGCLSWLAFIDELRTKNAEVVLSLTEELKSVYEKMSATYEIKDIIKQ